MSRQLTNAREFFDPWVHQSFGLDNIFNALQQFDRTSPPPKYPPHNIIRNGDAYVLEFALAGWKESELKVELEKNVLKVTGQKGESALNETDEFVHRGIANRSFQSQFTIGDNIKIVDGNLSDGVLTINMNIVVPEEDKPRLIQIGAKSTSDAKLLNKNKK
jgi:molecular chaperone IbpA